MKARIYSSIITLVLIKSLVAQDENNQLGPEFVDKTNETNVIVPTKTQKEPSPEALVVLPIRRAGTAYATMDIEPCGGVPKKKTNTLANSNSLINVVWEIRVPAINGNCSVKISPGLENATNFKTLLPADGSANSTGFFPCGRSQGFETKQFKLPDNYVCDQCTLQWRWATPKGSFYSCSDITINGQTIENCMARCHNGGACFNGKCMCTSEFYGEFCESSYNESSGAGWIILILILLIVLIAGAIFVITKKSGLSGNRPFGVGIDTHFNENSKAEPIVVKQQ